MKKGNISRRYSFSVSIEFTDEQPASSAGDLGSSMRAQSQSIEAAVQTSIAQDVGRSAVRSGMRVNVTRCHVEQTP